MATKKTTDANADAQTPELSAETQEAVEAANASITDEVAAHLANPAAPGGPRVAINFGWAEPVREPTDDDLRPLSKTPDSNA